MAYETASQITDMTNVSLGQIAQILFSKGFTSQMNRTYRDYDNILMAMKQQQPTTEREYRYLLMTALGVNAIQYQNQGVTDVAFPQGDLSTTQEVTAVMKKIQATIELDRNVWERVKLAQFKYVDNPLALEIMNKMDAVKRVQARSLYGDGSGCIGVVSSVVADAPTVVSGNLVVTLSSADTAVGGGNTNWFHKGEIVVFASAAGALHAVTTSSGTPTQYRVLSSDRKNRKVVFAALDSNKGVLTVTAVNAVVAADLIYPVAVVQNGVAPDTTGTPDWGKISPVMAGLESLTANDNRLVFNVNYTGDLGGSRFDAGAGLFNVSAIEESLNETEQNVGQGKYKYDNLIMPYNAYSALLEGKEADRRFNSVEDSARGGRKFIYQYGDAALDCVKSYFCPFNRIFSIPKPASGEMGETGYALEFRGTDFRDVTAGGQKEFLKLVSGQYVNSVQSFLEAYAVLVAKQPAAVNVIHNFLMV